MTMPTLHAHAVHFAPFMLNFSPVLKTAISLRQTVAWAREQHLHARASEKDKLPLPLCARILYWLETFACMAVSAERDVGHEGPTRPPDPDRCGPVQLYGAMPDRHVTATAHQVIVRGAPGELEPSSFHADELGHCMQFREV